MTDFLITTEPGEHHRLQISWNGDHSLIYLSTNARTMACSPAMAEEIMRGLMAILKGGFERAISETSLQMEQEDAKYRANRGPTTVLPTAAPKPTLDLL